MVGSDNHIAELLNISKLSIDQHRCGHALVRWAGGATQRAGRHQHVLSRQRLQHVINRQIQTNQFIRIDPDAHGAWRAKQLKLAYPGNTGNWILDIARDVVGQRGLIHGSVLGRDGDHHQKPSAGLEELQTLLCHGGRQLGRDVRHPVLNIHLRQVGIRSRRKGDHDLGLPVRVADRLIIKEALGAIELVFNDTGDRFGNLLGGRARILRSDRNGRRCDIGILGNRHEPDRHDPDKSDQDSEHPGKNRTVNKKLWH